MFQNAFRTRSAEHQRDLLTFLRNFGVGVLDFLPETIWERPFVIRSSPGAGKTSLLRLFTFESLRLIHERRDDFPVLHERMVELGALGTDGPTMLGVRIELERDYRSLRALKAPSDLDVRWFYRLLDARLAVSVIRAALGSLGLRFPTDQASFELLPRGDHNETSQSVSRIGGLRGDGILAAAYEAESVILDVIDSLTPVQWNDEMIGHGDLHFLKVLADSDILVAGTPLAMRPLALFDNGDHLDTDQRAKLIDLLCDRDLNISRWYAERLVALSAKDVIAPGAIEGRDFELLELEVTARGAGSRGAKHRFRFEKLLMEIGNQRAASSLERQGEDRAFFDYLDFDPEEFVGKNSDAIHEQLATRIEEDAGGDPRYARWIAEARAAHGYAGAVRLRELEIQIARDRDRPMRELFSLELLPHEAERLSGSNVREAAGLYLAKEFRLPYYGGAETIARLGFYNIEQFLSICGDVYDDMLAQLTMNRRPAVSLARQHRAIRRASDRLWRSLPQRLPHGRDVQRLLREIVAVCQKETFRPTAPYAPGVTGTALTMRDVEELIDSDARSRIRGAERLFQALGSAIAHNVVSAEADRSVKGDQYLVIYLNRLLCPRFGLPLGRGGFRDRSLRAMAIWMVDGERPLTEVVEEPELDLAR